VEERNLDAPPAARDLPPSDGVLVTGIALADETRAC
jgi:hypothetical protein